MKRLKKSHLVLIIASVLILLGCIGATAYLLLSNYQNVRVFKNARNNFLRGTPEALTLAESQLLQVVRNDSDNEAAYIMLAEIAEKRKTYPEQVYYCYMAHRLNPLSQENKASYIRALWFARYFDRLENFLAQQYDLPDKWNQLLLYAAGRNGNFHKYKSQLTRRDNDNAVGELAFLLFEYDHLSYTRKLAALKNIPENEWTTQEILAAGVELNLNSGDIDKAEQALEAAFKLNPYAFAPALGRFYANYRSLGKALPIFEKHLATYHDPMIALQAAELMCMVKRTGDIRKLRLQYQGDSGKSAMLFCYYLDALIAFANQDMAALKELLQPLRDNIRTPLARFMFFCADISGNNAAAVQESYQALLTDRNYPELQLRADEMLSTYLKHNFAKRSGDEDILLTLANLLYSRKKEPFTAKIILLAQKKRNSINISLLQDALSRFKQDQGILKIAIEYYLGQNDFGECGKLISSYRRNFPQNAADMLRYEIISALKKKDFDLASKLFRKAFAPEFLPEYWNFASVTMREIDLQFLSRVPAYAPFCQALLLIKKGNPAGACDILEKADAGGDLTLLFFAAVTLAENGRHQAALKKYALFPENSSYHLDVLLNTAELFAETGKLDRALDASEKAYKLAPDLAEAQFCYADKLARNGNYSKIPDIVKLRSSTPFAKRMKELWISGMQQKIKECNWENQREKVRELCRKLLAVAPGDAVALECLKKLNKMPQ